MDISFICTRKRKDFGKPCVFVDVGPSLIVEIDQNPAQREDFYMIPTIDKEIDNSSRMCAHEVNTVSYPTESRGMNHMEGGWPASVDSTDEDSMARFRKKVEKDKSYVNSVKSLAEFLENFIMENNSINIYEEYFEGERINRNTDFSVRNIGVFHDLNGSYRKVSDLSWTKDSSKFAVAYTLRQADSYPKDICVDSYLWDVENCISPMYVFKSNVFMTCVECSQTDANLILSGSLCGQVALWDIRTNNHAQMLSNALKSHTQKVTGLKWLVGKHDMACFSTSTDGKMIAWDVRNMSSPTEIVQLEDLITVDDSNLASTYSISCLEYDVTLPNKFMVGTEQGVVLSFNRKYKETNEILSYLYDCSYGPLLAVERNAFFPQLFATCGTSSVKMWSDTLPDFPILNMISRDGYFTDIAWSPTRASTMYASKSTGVLEVWDIPGKNKDALIKIKLADEPILAVAVNNHGGQIACGTTCGSVQLLNIPDYLKSCSEIEIDLVKNCVRESDKVVGGKPRSERLLETDAEYSATGMDDDMWDPPEKAEDLFVEYNLRSKEFLIKDESAEIKEETNENDDYKDESRGFEGESQEIEDDISESYETEEESCESDGEKDVSYGNEGESRESDDTDDEDTNESEAETRESDNDEDDINKNEEVTRESDNDEANTDEDEIGARNYEDEGEDKSITNGNEGEARVSDSNED